MLNCPACQHDETRILDSRGSDEGKRIRRRRVCVKCHQRFTTYEQFRDFDATMLAAEIILDPPTQKRLLEILALVGKLGTELRDMTTEIGLMADEIERDKKYSVNDLPPRPLPRHIARSVERVGDD